MAIKYGMSATDSYKSYRVNTSREILHCSNDIKYYLTNVSVVETTKKTICVNPDEIKAVIDTNEFCVDSINGRFNSRVTPQWEAKPGASSDLPKGSVLNRLAQCTTALYVPYSEVTVTLRGKGNPQSVSSSIIGTILNYINGLDQYQADYTSGQYIDMGEDVDANLSDWERGNKDFLAVVDIRHTGDNYVINHSFNLNLETGIGEVRIEKTIYDNTELTDLISVINQLKNQ